ncbi:MAG: RidA family protein, partial [Mesorhizobium sp.]
MIKYFQSGSRMSQAVVYGGLVHIAGQVADNRKAGIEGQTSDVLSKIEALLVSTCCCRPRLR